MKIMKLGYTWIPETEGKGLPSRNGRFWCALRLICVVTDLRSTEGQSNQNKLSTYGPLDFETCAWLAPETCLGVLAAPVLSPCGEDPLSRAQDCSSREESHLQAEARATWLIPSY